MKEYMFYIRSDGDAKKSLTEECKEKNIVTDVLSNLALKVMA
jgi:hypothetical protein